jgi:DNA-directed RNA polymerase subunit RPC12/RpoP
VEKEIKDKQIELDGVIIPYCKEGGIEWYPVKYVVEQFLLKGYNRISIVDKCKDYTKRQVINYSFKGTSPQETNCMNKEGWIKYLSECKLNKNKDEDKIKRHNIFCDYIGCENKYEIVEKVQYDDYIKYCIEEYLSEHKKEDTKWYVCVKCGRKLPLDNKFFPPDDRVEDGYTHRCKDCKPSTYPISCNNTYIRNIYKEFGNDGFNVYNKDIIKFYNTYCHNKNFEFKDNNENKLKIIQWYYNNNLLDKEQLHRDYIKEIFNFKFYTVDNRELNKIISNNDCESRPWLYPNFVIDKLSFKKGKELLTRYIKENNIQIDDILQYEGYEQLLKDAKLGQFARQTNDWTTLEFIVKYYNNEYAGYKFVLKSTNYYKKKENMIFDMKYYIEKDFKIPTEKIPLYVTKWSLHQNASSLYYALYKKYSYNTLFEWINDCYPNKFIELDFDVNPYRSNFDSLEEAQVDEQIRSKLGNIIHNERNRPDTIIINGMTPDWIVCLNKGTYLVEYWGMYTKYDISKSTGVQYYMNKMKRKYIKYGELMKVGYKHLYIYPDDLKNNFEGLHIKLDSIVK